MKLTIPILALALVSTIADAQTAGGRGGGGAGAGRVIQDPGAQGQIERRQIAPGAAASTVAAVPGASYDTYSQFLYSPDLVMRNQAGINLLEPQRTRIISEMSQTQVKFTEIQWTLSAEEEKLNKLLQEPNPSEQAVLAQMDRVLSVEQNLKRTQMQLMVRVKNVLEPEQQAALSRIRSSGSAPTGAAAVMRRGGGGE